VIYSLLQSKPRSEDDGFRGLGHVDSRKDVLDIDFDITLPSNDSPDRSKARSGRRKIQVNETKTITVTLAQDKTALRSRKGDTGSILWKAR